MDAVKSVYGFDDFGERLCEVVRELAEKVGISAAEAAGYISKAIQGVKESVISVVDELTQFFEQLEGSGIFDIEPRARRRKIERERARVVEQTYRTKIKQFERVRPFRRIYKPP